MSFSVGSVAIFHVNAFFGIRTSEVGVGWGSSFRHKKPIEEMLQRFAKGRIEPKYLDGQMSNIIPQVENFQKDWKAACVVYPGVSALFEQITALSKSNIPVYIIGNIDPLQKEAIEKECGPLPGTLFLSCEKEKVGEELLASLLKEIQAKHPSVGTDNIFMYYNPAQSGPWYERLGLGAVRKFSDPIQKLLDDKRKSEIDLVEEYGRRGAFQALTLDPSKEKPNLVAQLRERSDFCFDQSFDISASSDPAGEPSKVWAPAFRRRLDCLSYASGQILSSLSTSCSEEFAAVEEDLPGRKILCV